MSVVDSIENVTICYGETHTWNGNIYNETGLYEVTLSSMTGCDSIAKLNLTVLPEVPATIVEKTVCAGEEFVWDANNQTYTESVKDTITLQNAAAGLDGSRFAGAVMADKAVNFAGGDGERKIIYCLFFAV